MKSSPFLLAAACVLTACSAPANSAPAAAASAPAYPISAIVQADLREQPVAGAPLGEVVAAARLAYFDDTPPLRLARDARPAGSPPVIVYMGGSTTNGADVLWLEKEFRRGIAMIQVAKLAHDLDATTREFTLTEPRAGELAVVASTADSLDLKDRSRFCYWLRLGDELMKVTAVDAATGKVVVERGFDRSTPAAHAAGTPALGPVYLGNRDRPSARFSDSWPGANNRIRYSVEPSSPEGQAYKARCVVEVMRAGFDGAWWDTFSPQPGNICDALGRPIRGLTWNPAAGRQHDFASSLAALQVYIRNVRALVREQTGRDPVIYANHVGGSYEQGSKILINNPETSGQLNGYCFEDSFLVPKAAPPKKIARGVADPVIPGPPPTTYEPVTGKIWLRNVNVLADASRTRRHVIAMIGAAGYLAGRFNSDLPDHARLLRYGYASYLLTVTAERATSFGLPLAVQSDEGHAPTATPWPALLLARIGHPSQPNDISALQIPGTDVYVRKFQHGYVAVNPAEKGDPVEVAVPAGMLDAETGRPVVAATVKLAPGDALVLVGDGGT